MYECVKECIDLWVIELWIDFYWGTNLVEVERSQ